MCTTRYHDYGHRRPVAITLTRSQLRACSSTTILPWTVYPSPPPIPHVYHLVYQTTCTHMVFMLEGSTRNRVNPASRFSSAAGALYHATHPSSFLPYLYMNVGMGAYPVGKSNRLLASCAIYWGPPRVSLLPLSIDKLPLLGREGKGGTATTNESSTMVGNAVCLNSY